MKKQGLFLKTLFLICGRCCISHLKPDIYIVLMQSLNHATQVGSGSQRGSLVKDKENIFCLMHLNHGIGNPWLPYYFCYAQILKETF